MSEPETKQAVGTANLRIRSLRPISPPAAVVAELPNDYGEQVAAARAAVHSILNGSDDRVLVVAGPCSIHDEKAAVEYAQRLAALSGELAADLFIIMRVYFEKPRTSIGWKGLINDPGIDGSFRIDEGLRVARRILLQINRLGMPCGTEMLDVFTPQYFADLLAWGAIGARTTESQGHRELASGLSFPVGFKNGTSGNIRVAVNAVHAAREPHHFFCIDEQGKCSIGATAGNEDTHIILRGGTEAPNYSSAGVQAAAADLVASGLPTGVMVDCSHANSGKDYRNQPKVCADVGEQIAGGERDIVGVMLESNLNEGSQPVGPPDKLAYGVSITDSCMGWSETEKVLRALAASVAKRRSMSAG